MHRLTHRSSFSWLSAVSSLNKSVAERMREDSEHADDRFRTNEELLQEWRRRIALVRAGDNANRVQASPPSPPPASSQAPHSRAALSAGGHVSLRMSSEERHDQGLLLNRATSRLDGRTRTRSRRPLRLNEPLPAYHPGPPQPHLLSPTTAVIMSQTLSAEAFEEWLAAQSRIQMYRYNLQHWANGCYAPVAMDRSQLHLHPADRDHAVAPCNVHQAPVTAVTHAPRPLRLTNAAPTLSAPPRLLEPQRPAVVAPPPPPGLGPAPGIYPPPQDPLPTPQSLSAPPDYIPVRVSLANVEGPTPPLATQLQAFGVTADQMPPIRLIAAPVPAPVYTENPAVVSTLSDIGGPNAQPVVIYTAPTEPPFAASLSGTAAPLDSAVEPLDSAPVTRPSPGSSELLPRMVEPPAPLRARRGAPSNVLDLRDAPVAANSVNDPRPAVVPRRQMTVSPGLTNGSTSGPAVPSSAATPSPRSSISSVGGRSPAALAFANTAEETSAAQSLARLRFLRGIDASELDDFHRYRRLQRIHPIARYDVTDLTHNTTSSAPHLDGSVSDSGSHDAQRAGAWQVPHDWRFLPGDALCRSATRHDGPQEIDIAHAKVSDPGADELDVTTRRQLSI